MPARPQSVIVLVTTPTEDNAGKIAERLVEQRLAAGVHIAPVRSVYRWGDGINHATEFVLTVKTVAGRFEDIEKVIGELHPYEVPPLISIDIDAGKQSYLDWIIENTRNPRRF